MLRSLRFRLPALFLIGIVLSAVVATLIAVRFFQGYARQRTVAELRSESVGIVRLYSRQAGLGGVVLANLQREIGGDRVFFVPVVPGASLLAGSLPVLPRSTVPAQVLGGAVRPVTFSVGGVSYLGVARVVNLGALPAGAIVVAKPASVLRSRWLVLAEELAIAFGVGIPLAGALGVYFSRRITRPINALSAAADEVAGGNYAVAVPPGGGGGSEVERLAAHFGEMAARLAESEELSRHFLMSVSHELRTPLTAIRGHVAALREGVVEDETERQRSLAVISEEALRLERLVGDVLDLAKLDARRFAVLREEVDLRALSERAYATFAEEARRRGLDYRLELDDGAILVTDGDRVLQVISNLLANAVQATPPGGTVELALARSNGEVAVTVADTGPGIAPDERERVFRPFWSGDGGGTGLGLTIARELAVALGGRLELDSEPGRGSRFRLVLPVDQLA